MTEFIVLSIDIFIFLALKLKQQSKSDTWQIIVVKQRIMRSVIRDEYETNLSIKLMWSLSDLKTSGKNIHYIIVNRWELFWNRSRQKNLI